MLSQIDIAVAVVIAEQPDAKYEYIAEVLGISTSTAFKSVQQLRTSGLMLPEGRRVNRLALLEFLEHGLRYAFPAEPGRMRNGVPTAHSGPVLARELDSGEEPYVWASANGPVRGREIVPLVPHASGLPQRSPQAYEALSLVDALRVGRARERNLASRALRERFNMRTPVRVL